MERVYIALLGGFSVRRNDLEEINTLMAGSETIRKEKLEGGEAP